MTRRFLALGALALALAPGMPAEAAQPPVVIGLDIPLSPPGDPAAGQLIRRGAEMAVEYVNNEMKGVLGGRKIALAVHDSAGRTETGIAGYRRLVTREHAVAVAGFYHSSVNIAVNEVAKHVGVPTMGITSASDVTAKHYDIAFRTNAVDPIRVAAFLDFIKQRGFKRVSLVAETTDFGIGVIDETERQNSERKLGLEIQRIIFDHSVTDLMPQLLQVKAFKPDLVINAGVGQPMDLMLDQAEEIGLLPQTPMLVSYDAPVRPQFWQLHPKNGAGIYFTTLYSPQQKLSDLGTWFTKHYEEKYKEPPVYAALSGFSDVMILAQAVDAAKSTDPKALIKSLETGAFEAWAPSPATFPRAPGVFWHNWSAPILIMQYTEPNQDWRNAKIIVEHAGTAP